MIGCDNDFCEYEWFHYSCVGNHEEMRVRVVSLYILVSETTRKCEYQWFHYSCVGNHEEMRVPVVSLFLCRKPRGKWYCSEECRSTGEN